jgi:hypothetical protein
LHSNSDNHPRGSIWVRSTRMIGGIRVQNATCKWNDMVTANIKWESAVWSPLKTVANDFTGKSVGERRSAFMWPKQHSICLRRWNLAFSINNQGIPSKCRFLPWDWIMYYVLKKGIISAILRKWKEIYSDWSCLSCASWSAMLSKSDLSVQLQDESSIKFHLYLRFPLIIHDSFT